MTNLAYLREDSPFYPLFPSGAVPIVNIMLPSQAECIGDGVQEVYMIDLDKLTEEQFERVVDLFITTRGYTGSREVARKEIRAGGLPVRASQVRCVSTDVPFFL